MAKEITDAQYKKLVAELKKNPGNSERHYAEASGIPLGQVGSVLYKAEVEADPSLKIAATGKAIAKAREDGIRWPRIAARTGKSVAECKKLFEEATGKSAAESWTGRGRRFDGATGKPAKSATSGRRGAKTAPAKSATSGRRGAKTAPAKSAAGRRGTRAQASDPK